MKAASSHLGSSFHRLGGGVFDLARFVTRKVLAAFLLGFWGRGEERGYLQCKCIIMSPGVTLGQRWKRRACVLHLWLFGLSAPRSWKSQGQDVVLSGF